jgi:hypothetical protein
VLTFDMDLQVICLPLGVARKVAHTYNNALIAIRIFIIAVEFF